MDFTFYVGPTTSYDDNYVVKTAVNGAEFCQGVVSDCTIASNGSSGTSKATGFGQYITGWRDVTMKVSQTFNANFLTLGVSVAGGKSYHQYTVVEIEGAGRAREYAARYSN